MGARDEDGGGHGGILAAAPTPPDPNERSGAKREDACTRGPEAPRLSVKGRSERP